ncbi:PD-(D/E)XK nuclease family protein [Treponema sp.]
MNTKLGETIVSYLADRETRFVFPSAVASRFWAQAIAELILGPVDLDRFIAWDDFKTATLASDRSDLRAANGASRAIFAASLLAENAEAAKKGTPFLQEIIAAQHADSYSSFIASISHLLPALDSVITHIADTSDPYFLDLRLIHSKYSAFLNTFGLYESSWNRVPFRQSNTIWVLFYPELAEDWPEYIHELEKEKTVHIVPLSRLAEERPGEAGQSRTMVYFASAQEELRWIATTIRMKLDEATLSASDIAISIPDVHSYAERLQLELRLRDIPVDIRAGKSLADQSAGRLLSSLSACRSTRWSFRAIKDLLLDAAFPWKDKKLIDALIEFGLRYRCVSGFPENGKEIDVWERSFARFKGRDKEIHLPLAAIEVFYRILKRDIISIVGAKDFSTLRTKFLFFKSNHFKEEELDSEMDKVLARMLVELAELADTQKRLFGIQVHDPFSLFKNHLRTINYVFQAEDLGVKIYDYRVAAGIHPRLHIIANATQDAATVRAKPAPFLREDRRIGIGFVERDLSSLFIQAYEISGKTVLFTASRQGFLSHSVPHREFSKPRFKQLAGKDLYASTGDPFDVERDLALGLRNTDDILATSPRSVQREAYTRIRSLWEGKAPLDLRKLNLEDKALQKQLRFKLTKDSTETPNARLSPTDLNDFNSCAFSWLLRRGLDIEDKQSEIETIDQRDLGTLYHRILESFFKKIAEIDIRFRIEKLDEYKKILEEQVETTLQEASVNEGAFQESVYAMLKKRILGALLDYLDSDASKLDACQILGSEFPLRKEYPELGLALSGIADLVLRANDGSLRVIDFKTGMMPSSSTLIVDENKDLANVQMAAYIAMLEKEATENVQEAYFYSIDTRDYRRLISAETAKKSNSILPLPRDEYEEELEALDESMEAAASALDSGYFPIPPPGSRSPCIQCRVSSVCRLSYAGGEA